MRMDAIRYALARGREASTYAGIGVVLALAGFNVDPGLWQTGIEAAVAVCGFLAVLLRDKGAA